MVKQKPQPEQKPDSSVTPQGQCAPARRQPHAARDLSSGRFSSKDKEAR